MTLERERACGLRDSRFVNSEKGACIFTLGGV
jgi:hypothetical protein